MILRLVFISFFIFSCTNGVPRIEEPDNLVPREEMVDVLTELMKLESAIQIKYVTIDKYHNAIKVSGDSLLNVKGISYDQFEKSMEYYASRQDEMIGIYSEVLDVLNKELGDIEASKAD